MAQSIGRTNQLRPGGMARMEVAGRIICLANVGGQYYAFSDICPHFGCRLSTGWLQDTVVTCPCHGAEFDVTTGTLITGPGDMPLRTYPISVVGDELQI